jgi:isochorismate pyruvate lyase
MQRRRKQAEPAERKGEDADRFSSIEPDECQTIEQIRAGVDEIDNLLLDLLVRRQAYTVRAARIKKDAGMPVRDENRLAHQIARANTLGAAKGLSPLIVEPLFALMIERHVLFETMLHEQGS